MSLEDRIRKAEDALQPIGPGDEEIVLTVVEESVMRNEFDELVPIRREPVGFSEIEWNDFGGQRVGLRRAIYSDDSGPSKAND